MKLTRWSSIGPRGTHALASASILEVSLARRCGRRLEWTRAKAVRFASLWCLALTFYPLECGRTGSDKSRCPHALVALGLLCHLIGRSGLGGALLGACCLVKPQYGVLLLWSLARGHWRFALGYAAILVPGLIVSIGRFGLHNHLRYLEVLGASPATGKCTGPIRASMG